MSNYSETGFVDDEPSAKPRHRIKYDPASVRGEDAFQVAARHSRLVRWLKFILPALAVAGAGLFWATLNFVPGSFNNLVEVAGIDIESNSVVMDSPHISGFEGTRRAYEVKADSAVQNLSDPKVITFNQIEASIGMDDAGTAMINAQLGVYDGNANSLSLTKGINIETTDGYSARFTEAAIDLDAGSLVTDQPLEIRSRDGLLRANGVRVIDRGKRVSFVGGVSVSFQPPGELMAATPGSNGGAGQ